MRINMYSNTTLKWELFFRKFNELVFEVLGLRARVREEVYQSVVTLVRARLEKAKSV